MKKNNLLLKFFFFHSFFLHIFPLYFFLTFSIKFSKSQTNRVKENVGDNKGGFFFYYIQLPLTTMSSSSKISDKSDSASYTV